MTIWLSLKEMNDYIFGEYAKEYAKNIRVHLKLYPEDRRKLVIDNYKIHGGKVFKIFSEVNKKNTK